MTLRVFKWVGITVCVLLCLLITAYVIIYFRVNARITKKYDVTLEKINVMYDSAAIARGSRIVGIRACKECHGEDLSGRVMADDNVIGRFVTANLTRGKGGLRPDFTEEDWVLAMKHGLRRDGSPLLLMPSHELSHMSEEDMSSIIAYCSTLPAVDNELPPSKLGPLAYVLTEFNQIPLLPAEMTDHSKPLVDAIKPEASVAYGNILPLRVLIVTVKTTKVVSRLFPAERIVPTLHRQGIQASGRCTNLCTCYAPEKLLMEEI